jgi:hypothetical protein
MGAKERRLSNAIYTATISWNAERAIQFEPAPAEFSPLVLSRRESWRIVVEREPVGRRSEAVQIRLKRPGGFGRPQGYFVQCNQADCQYVDENKPPCPLNAAMFADEIKAAEEARAQRSE